MWEGERIAFWTQQSCEMSISKWKMPTKESTNTNVTATYVVPIESKFPNWSRFWSLAAPTGLYRGETSQQSVTVWNRAVTKNRIFINSESPQLRETLENRFSFTLTLGCTSGMSYTLFHDTVLKTGAVETRLIHRKQFDFLYFLKVSLNTLSHLQQVTMIYQRAPTLNSLPVCSVDSSLL